MGSSLLMKMWMAWQGRITLALEIKWWNLISAEIRRTTAVAVAVRRSRLNPALAEGV